MEEKSYIESPFGRLKHCLDSLPSEYGAYGKDLTLSFSDYCFLFYLQSIVIKLEDIEETINRGGK